MKPRSVGVELFHADRQTHTNKLIIAFRNFANASRSPTFCPHRVLYVSYTDIRTNSDYFPIQHKLTGFYNRAEVCLLRGTDWVFKHNPCQSGPDDGVIDSDG